LIFFTLFACDFEACGSWLALTRGDYATLIIAGGTFILTIISSVSTIWLGSRKDGRQSR